MAVFHENRIYRERGNYSSTRIRKEQDLLNQYYSPSFVSTKIKGCWGNEELICNLKFSIVGVNCNVKIVYDGLTPPKSWLIEPFFKNPQHIYKTEGNLCLYDPEKNEWTRSSHIYNTFVPWSMEWVIFQMIYEETGEWQHPERHPDSPMTNAEIKEFCFKNGLSFDRIKPFI